MCFVEKVGWSCKLEVPTYMFKHIILIFKFAAFILFLKLKLLHHPSFYLQHSRIIRILKVWYWMKVDLKDATGVRKRSEK